MVCAVFPTTAALLQYNTFNNPIAVVFGRLLLDVAARKKNGNKSFLEGVATPSMVENPLRQSIVGVGSNSLVNPR